MVPLVYLLVLSSLTISPTTGSLASLQSYSDFRIMLCNTSLVNKYKFMDLDIQVMPPLFPPDTLGEEFYCSYEFQAPEGYYATAVVKSVVTAHRSYNHSVRSCGMKNYLRIWDGFHEPVWKPTELCGHYQENTINVKRISSGRNMKIDFRVQKLSEHTTYDVRVSFKRIELSHNTIETRYGGYNDVLGKVPNTLCDWNIKVDKCIGFCEITSPGYPGIYPPHSACLYKLVNTEGERVELYLSGMNRRSGGKFDLKRSENCAEDKVVVYDGGSVEDPIIGIFCGEMTIPELISTGPAMLVQLVTLAGSAPWHYSGFDARVTHRYPKEFMTGMPIQGTPCSWEFNSTIDRGGTLHTPDFQTTEKAECEYRFYGQPGEIVEFEIRITYLQPNEEFLFVYDKFGSFPEKIWSENLNEVREEMKYFNTTSSSPVIQYQLNIPQLSNGQPVFIHYRFIYPAPPLPVISTTPTPIVAPVHDDDTSTAASVPSAIKSIVITFVIYLLRLIQFLSY